MTKQLSTPRMLGLCLGEFARAVLGGLIVTYTLKFFNVTPSSGLPLLLPAGMMGLLRGFGVVFDAITDPWVASLSDRCASPKGRRIPFLRWSAVPYAATCLLIFFPPGSSVSTGNVLWVGAMLLCYYRPPRCTACPTWRCSRSWSPTRGGGCSSTRSIL